LVLGRRTIGDCHLCHAPMGSGTSRLHCLVSSSVLFETDGHSTPMSLCCPEDLQGGARRLLRHPSSGPVRVTEP
jgi:hypothetical protein